MMGGYIKESKLINESFECSYLNLSTSSKVNGIGRWSLLKLYRYVRILFSVIIHLVFLRTDVCYITIAAKGMAFYKDAFIAILFKVFRKKIIYHFHNKGVSLGSQKLMNRCLYRCIFRNSYAILLSSYLYGDVRTYFPENRVFVCPNGVPLLTERVDYFREKNKEVSLLFLSNMIESKGVMILLDTCKKLNERGLLFKCCFVGGEGDVDSTIFDRRVNELGLQSCVKYLGGKYGSEKTFEFLNADIFVFPTFYHYECFPLVLLEAMQFELPVVSTYEGGIVDIVDDGVTGFLVEQRNVDDLTDKVGLLITDHQLRKNMGSAGYSKYLSEYTLSVFEDRLRKIFLQVYNM